MKIKQLTLYTDHIQRQLAFYQDVFGCTIIQQNETSFTVQIGYSELTFEQTDSTYTYHYCMLIPSNKLDASIKWVQDKVEIFRYENGRVIEPGPEGWNSESVYFLDGVGNVMEFIVRHDLHNHRTTEGFGPDDLLCVNEIGLVSKDLSQLNNVLETKLNSPLWYGNTDRFGANGTQDGLFLLVNNEKKKTWFPTDILPTTAPFYGTFECNGSLFDIRFENEAIEILKDHDH